MLGRGAVAGDDIASITDCQAKLFLSSVLGARHSLPAHIVQLVKMQGFGFSLCKTNQNNI